MENLDDSVLRAEQKEVGKTNNQNLLQMSNAKCINPCRRAGILLSTLFSPLHCRLHSANMCVERSNL